MDSREVLYPRYYRQFRKGLEELKTRRDICKENREDLVRFFKHLDADGISLHRKVIYLRNLLWIARGVPKKRYNKKGEKREYKLEGINKPFKEITKEDVEAFYTQFRSIRSLQTLNTFVACLKCFFRWIYGLTSQDPPNEAVKWLKKSKPTPSYRSEDLWTEEDMRKVMKVTKSLRDRCIMSILFEIGLRPLEARNLKIRDVFFNGNVVRICVHGKMEKKRGDGDVRRLVRSYHLIRQWVNKHPGKDDPNAWLWTTNGKPLSDDGMREIVKRCALEAGIRKKSNPYALRHSALTRNIYGNKDYTLQQACKQAGHVVGSKEAETYFHPSDNDMDNAARRANGIASSEEIDPARCIKCSSPLGVGSTVCEACGIPQDDAKAAKRIESDQKKLRFVNALEVVSQQNPELMKLKQAMEELVNRLEKGN
jgi:site-specific recombinase XerD